MYEVRIPDHIYRRAAEAAQAHQVSLEVFVSEAVQLHLQDDPENYDHLFTPDVLSELDAIVAAVDSGGKTFAEDEVEAHFDERRKAWLGKHPG